MHKKYFGAKFQTRNKMGEKNNLKITLHLSWLTDVLQKYGVSSGCLESTYFKWSAHGNIPNVRL